MPQRTTEPVLAWMIKSQLRKHVFHLGLPLCGVLNAHVSLAWVDNVVIKGGSKVVPDEGIVRSGVIRLVRRLNRMLSLIIDH